MKNRKETMEDQNGEYTPKSIINKGFLEIGKKLGIAIPAGLVLLLNIHPNNPIQNHMLNESVNTAKELNKLENNETVKHLRSADKMLNENMMLAQVHSNTHVDKNSPNVTRDGKHLNVHTNTHSNYTRY